MSSFIELFNQARMLMLEKKYAEAQNVLTKAEEVFNENETKISSEDIYILRGSIAFEQEDYEFAQESFEKALKKNKESVAACLGLGNVFYKVGLIEEAKTMLEWAVKNDNTNPTANSSLAKINKLLGYPESHNSLFEEEVEEEESLSESFQQEFNEAYNLFLNNKYSEALEKLDKLNSKYNEEIYLLRGNIYLADEDIERAKEIFEQILEENPNSTSAYVGLGEYFYKKGLKQDAKVMYEQALVTSPKDEYALVGLARVNQDLGLSPIHNLANFFSNTEIGSEVNEKMEKAFALFSEKKFGESLVILQNLDDQISAIEDRDLDEVLSRIKNLKGFDYLSMGKIESAKVEFESSLQLNSDSSQACAGLGEVFYLQGNDKEAKIMFEWGVKNNRKNIFAVAGLAKVNKSLNLPADHNTILIGVDFDLSEEFDSLITQAYERFAVKAYLDSIKLLEKVKLLFDEENLTFEGKKSLGGIYNFIGYCHLGLGNIAEAQSQFENALMLNPDSSQACAGLGEVFYLLEQDENSKIMYEWAVRNEPKNKIAIAGLDKVNKILGVDEQLIKTYAKRIEDLINDAYKDFENKDYESSIIKIDETEQLVQDNFSEEEKEFTISSLNNFKGFNLLALSRINDAKKCFEIALENNPNSSQACAGLGEVLFLEGKDEEAKKMYEWAVKNNPNNNYAKSGLAKVNRVLGKPENDNSLFDKK